MKDFAAWALDTAVVRGATYAEVRVLDTRQRYLSTKNGQPSQVRESQSLGLGIRVIAGGGWGFAATDTLTHADVDRAAALAVEIAKASALTKKHDVELVPEQKIVDHWAAPCRIDPFSVSVSSCLDLLIRINVALGKVKGVTLAEGAMDFRRVEQLFLSSIGSEIYQLKTQTGA